MPNVVSMEIYLNARLGKKKEENLIKFAFGHIIATQVIDAGIFLATFPRYSVDSGHGICSRGRPRIVPA